MEEAWTTRYPDAGTNCARVIPETPAEWRNPDEAARWAKVSRVLDLVTGSLEEYRRDKTIGSALDAAPHVALTADDFKAFDGIDPAEVFRTSEATIRADAALESGIVFKFAKADHPKCARSWRRVSDVGSDPAYLDLSARDADAVRWWDARHA